MISLKQKVTLITGGSRGIGRAIALLFAKAGSDLVIGYCSNRHCAIEVRELAKQMGANADVIKADVSDRSQVDTIVDFVIKKHGQIDILVNNAGIWKHNPIKSMSEEQLRETIDVNLLGNFYAITSVVPHMIEQESGAIVNISSTAGQRGEAFYSPYAASKGAVISLTKSLAVELAPHNIRVNCVAPGWVDTDMSAPVLSGPGKEKVTRQIPLGRVATPDEIAASVLFLASDLASFITGEILNVNGGAVLCG